MHKQVGGYEVFRGPMYQQGYGLGGYFRKFFKWLVPIAEKHVMPHIKSGLEVVKNQAFESVADIAKDAIKGKNFKESVKENVTQAIDNLKTKAESKLKGEGLQKKRKIIFKKRKLSDDIFD